MPHRIAFECVRESATEHYDGRGLRQQWHSLGSQGHSADAPGKYSESCQVAFKGGGGGAVSFQGNCAKQEI